MTPQEAKKLSLEVWEYLKEHPAIENKIGLPKELYDRIRNMGYQCPLCKLYSMNTSSDLCPGCPLKTCARYSEYSRWFHSPRGHEGMNIRREYATKIVEILKAWEPDNE